VDCSKENGVSLSAYSVRFFGTPGRGLSSSNNLFRLTFHLKPRAADDEACELDKRASKLLNASLDLMLSHVGFLSGEVNRRAKEKICNARNYCLNLLRHRTPACGLGAKNVVGQRAVRLMDCRAFCVQHYSRAVVPRYSDFR
jgi:hypothetical protein